MVQMTKKESAEAWTKWVMRNADYYTVIRHRFLNRQRWEQPSLRDAEALATRMLEQEPDARFMIYAVAGVHSTWVKNIQSPSPRGRCA